MKSNYPKCNSLLNQSLNLQALGTLIAANAMLATIPATRNSLLVFFFRVPFDKTIMYHRWMGRLVAILATTHFVGYLATWAKNGIDIGEQVSYSVVTMLISRLAESPIYLDFLDFYLCYF